MCLLDRIAVFCWNWHGNRESCFFIQSLYSDQKRGGVMSVRGEEEIEPVMQHTEE